MFTGNYSISLDSNIKEFTIQDTSDYTSEPKAGFSGRRIVLTLSGGATLVPAGTTTSYIDWPFSAGDSLTLDVLDRDYAISVKVDWFVIAPQPGSTYEKVALYAFTGNSENFYYGLTSQQASDPNIITDNEYFSNKSKLRTNIDDANQAVLVGEDIQSAQAALDNAYYLMINQNYFF